METYSESRHVRPFDWNAFFAKESYSPEEIAVAVRMSSSWTTCAVGNQCNVIKRDRYGVPLDWELRSLGAYFNDSLCHMNRSYRVADKRQFYKEKEIAIATLKKIEQRSSVLIRYLTNNPDPDV